MKLHSKVGFVAGATKSLDDSKAVVYVRWPGQNEKTKKSKFHHLRKIGY